MCNLQGSRSVSTTKVMPRHTVSLVKDGDFIAKANFAATRRQHADAERRLLLAKRPPQRLHHLQVALARTWIGVRREAAHFGHNGIKDDTAHTHLVPYPILLLPRLHAVDHDVVPKAQFVECGIA